MSNIVKHTQFKNVVNELWNKVKNNFVTITKSLEFVSKVKPNLITEKTTIIDGYIQGNKVSSVDNKPNTSSYMNAGSFFIYELLKVSNNTKISHITIGVDEKLNVGDVVSSIKVGYAKDTVDYAKVRVEKYVIDNGTAIVHENKDTNITCTRAVTIEVNDTVTDDVKLIVGCEHAIWGAKDAQTTGLASGGGVAPNVGQVVQLGYDNWVGKVVVYADGVSLNDLSNTVTTIGTELNNKVDKTQLTTTSKANGVVQLNAQGKIDASMLGTITTNNVHVVADKNEANNMVTQGTANKGDIFLLRDTKKSYMYTTTTGSDFDTRFSELTVATGTLFSVNNVSNASGHITLTASDINANVGGNTRTIQEYLSTIGNDLHNVNINVNQHDTRLLRLESKHPTYNVGDIVPTFKSTAQTYYTIDGCQFMYCGTSRLLNYATYPEFGSALGIPTGTVSFNTPVIPDETIRFDHTRNAIKRYYVCIKNK